MITGSLYHFDFKELMQQALTEAKDKYRLTLINEARSYSYDYSNSLCGITIFVSDIQSFKWDFYNPVHKDKYVYDPSLFFEFMLGIERPRYDYSKSVIDLASMVQETFANINRELMDYMAIPMSGDFSWRDAYVSKLKQRNRYIKFSFDTSNSHSEERRRIARMYITQEAGWQEAISSYFEKHYPDGGKEFDV